jgi:hypothetical protein
MTLPAPIFRLSLLPLAILYAWITTWTEDLVVGALAVAMIFTTVLMILRGVKDDISPMEAGVLATLWGALSLAALFPIASRATPGICTDSILTFEIALAFFVTGGIATWAHIWSKHLFPASGKGLTRSEQKWINAVPVWLVSIISLAPLGLMAATVDRGACAPGTE